MITSYVSLYQTKDATPYMHILTNHETVQLNGNMTRFAMPGLEKLNGLCHQMVLLVNKLCHGKCTNTGVAKA